jgi:alanine racemase
VLNYPYAYINLEALTHNLSKVKQFAPNSKVFAVIKANAYGHGAIEAAKALSEADAFAVARVDEAIELREAGITKTIILLEGVRSTVELKLASQHQLSPVFHSDYQLDFLEAVDIHEPLSGCWLMLETGMY